MTGGSVWICIPLFGLCESLCPLSVEYLFRFFHAEIVEKLFDQQATFKLTHYRITISFCNTCDPPSPILRGPRDPHLTAYRSEYPCIPRLSSVCRRQKI